VASKTFPYVERSLLEYLDKVFPNSLPVKLLSEAELARLIGQQDVIARLRQIHTEQVKQELGGTN
jgi:hypothetical protein